MEKRGKPSFGNRATASDDREPGRILPHATRIQRPVRRLKRGELADLPWRWEEPVSAPYGERVGMQVDHAARTTWSHTSFFRLRASRRRADQ